MRKQNNVVIGMTNILGKEEPFLEVRCAVPGLFSLTSLLAVYLSHSAMALVCLTLVCGVSEPVSQCDYCLI